MKKKLTTTELKNGDDVFREVVAQSFTSHFRRLMFHFIKQPIEKAKRP